MSVVRTTALQGRIQSILYGWRTLTIVMTLFVLLWGGAFCSTMGWVTRYLAGHRQYWLDKRRANQVRVIDTELRHKLFLAGIPGAMSALNMLRSKFRQRELILVKWSGLAQRFPHNDSVERRYREVRMERDELIAYENELRNACWSLVALRASWQADTHIAGLVLNNK